MSYVYCFCICENTLHTASRTSDATSRASATHFSQPMMAALCLFRASARALEFSSRTSKSVDNRREDMTHQSHVVHWHVSSWSCNPLFCFSVRRFQHCWHEHDVFQFSFCESTQELMSVAEGCEVSYLHILKAASEASSRSQLRRRAASCV